MTWGSASYKDPPARAPLALQSITAITTYHLYPSHPSTFTDQVSQIQSFKSFPHRSPAECVDERDLLVLCTWPRIAFPFPPELVSSLLCSYVLLLPSSFFSSIALLSSERPAGMLKLCSSLRSSNSDTRPTSPFRHHFLPHNKGKASPPLLPYLFASFSMSISSHRHKSTSLLWFRHAEMWFDSCAFGVSAREIHSPGLFDTLPYEVKGCVWPVDATEAHVMRVANAQLTNHMLICVMSLCLLHRFFLHRYVLASWLL